MAQADLLARLEAVTVRLERAAARMGGGGGGGDDDELPLFVTEFQNIVKEHLPKIIAACNDVELKGCGDMFQRAFDCVVDYVSKVPKSKKPSVAEMDGALKEGTNAINDANKKIASRKTPVKQLDHWKVVSEALQIINFVRHAPPGMTPATFITTQQGSTDYNLLRVQKNYKDDKNKAFVAALKTFQKKLVEYGNEFFKKDGLTWNPKGVSISEATGGGAVTTSGSNDDKKEESKTEPKKAAPKKAGGGGNMGALFGAINKLQDPNDRAKLYKNKGVKKNKGTSGKVTMKAAPKKAGRQKGEAKITNKGNQIIVENHNEGIFDVEKGTMKTSVYITKGDGATYTIKEKVKSVSIDNCIKCRVFVSEVVSTVEVVNCKSLTLIVQKKAPSVTIDRSQDPHLILTREAFNNEPSVVTSEVSNMNIQIPGKTDNDDSIEIPVPYQFVTRVDPKTGIAKTEEVKHE